MAIKRKPQTEAKAKGLVGWKNGRQSTTSKDAVANKSVGDYKGRTLNLSKKQLGAAGRRAAASATVDISKTTFDKSKGGVLGPKGKPLTGRVDLGGGNIAVYRNGVRVRASSTKPKGGGGGGNGPVVDKPRASTTDRGPALQADRNPRPGVTPKPGSRTGTGTAPWGVRKAPMIWDPIAKKFVRVPPGYRTPPIKR